MDLESCVINVLEEIQTASEKGENYDLHLECEVVKEIADAYEATKWIEIY